MSRSGARAGNRRKPGPATCKSVESEPRLPTQLRLLARAQPPASVCGSAPGALALVHHVDSAYADGVDLMASPEAWLQELAGRTETELQLAADGLTSVPVTRPPAAQGAVHRLIEARARLLDVVRSLPADLQADVLAAGTDLAEYGMLAMAAMARFRLREQERPADVGRRLKAPKPRAGQAERDRQLLELEQIAREEGNTTARGIAIRVAALLAERLSDAAFRYHWQDLGGTADGLKEDAVRKRLRQLHSDPSR